MRSKALTRALQGFIRLERAARYAPVGGQCEGHLGRPKSPLKGENFTLGGPDAAPSGGPRRRVTHANMKVGVPGGSLWGPECRIFRLGAS